MKLAIYDFDGTYMKSEILRKAYKFWKEEKLNPKTYRKIWHKILRRNLFYKLGLFGWTKPSFRANAMALTADLFKSVDKEVCDKFLEDLYIHLQPFVNKSIKEQLLKDKEEGYYTILLSGNFDIILKPYIHEGFDEVIGSIAEKEGKLLSSDEINIIIHDLKAKTIKDKFPNADYQNSKAYADSYYDLPILELVGNPIAVNPDKELSVIAQNNNFNIMRFEI
jgi:phosphoserine phosphatase